MTSAINSTDINEAYPVAGQDNDSQGFRDNFTLIKNGLATAASEITTLQGTSARLDQANDFNGNNITEANFLKTTEEVYVSTEIESDTNINWSLGSYQIITVGEDITLTLAEWPTSGVLGKIRIALKGDGSSRTVTWSTVGGGTIKKNSSWPTVTNQVSVTSNVDPVFIDFWTSDAGLTVYAQYHGQFNE